MMYKSGAQEEGLSWRFKMQSHKHLFDLQSHEWIRSVRRGVYVGKMSKNSLSLPAFRGQGLEEKPLK